MPSRAAGPSDIDYLTATIRDGFTDDPVWGPALRRSDGSRINLGAYWRVFVEGALRFGTAHMATDGGAVSIWLPPGAAELSHEQLGVLETLIRLELDAPALAALEELYTRFEASREGRPDHYYLSLLAAHPAFRGQGRGQILLAEDLARWDEAGVPAYLESTNAANNHRYARAGFAADGGFAAVRDDTWITAMWRQVGGAASGED